MPIYEYLCGKCNLIFQFYIRTPGSGSVPACPRCGDPGLERVMSSFSTTRRASSSAGDMDGSPDLGGLDESDPRSMARAIRHMADDMGEDLGPELDEAITRLESGEDPDQIERELEESGLGDEDDGTSGGFAGPGRDPGLYEG